MKNDSIINLRLPASLLDLVRKISAERRWSVAETIRYSIEKCWLEDNAPVSKE
jgi:hypothetical protein